MISNNWTFRFDEQPFSSISTHINNTQWQFWFDNVPGNCSSLLIVDLCRNEKRSQTKDSDVKARWHSFQWTSPHCNKCQWIFNSSEYDDLGECNKYHHPPHLFSRIHIIPLSIIVRYKTSPVVKHNLSTLMNRWSQSCVSYIYYHINCKLKHSENNFSELTSTKASDWTALYLDFYLLELYKIQRLVSILDFS